MRIRRNDSLFPEPPTKQSSKVAAIALFDETGLRNARYPEGARISGAIYDFKAGVERVFGASHLPQCEGPRSNVSAFDVHAAELSELSRSESSKASVPDLDVGVLDSIRDDMDRELERLVRPARNAAPADLDICLARVALARYLLDLADRLYKQVLKSKSPALYALYEAAQDAIVNVLGSRYLRKTHEKILEDYLDGEVAIRACALAVHTPVLDLPTAIRREWPEHASHDSDEGFPPLQRMA